ncbi:MAG: hypothetical protein ACOCRO_04805 [Halanaerobiales bacterium]
MIKYENELAGKVEIGRLKRKDTFEYKDNPYIMRSIRENDGYIKCVNLVTGAFKLFSCDTLVTPKDFIIKEDESCGF